MGHMTANQIASSIEGYIRKEYRVSPEDPRFSPDAHLWEEGYLDSMGVVELIGFVETEFDITIPEAALFDENFTNINGMANIIAGLIGTG